MKNIQDVLREKETKVEQLTREIKLLRAAARILEDEDQPGRIDATRRHVDAAAVKEPVAGGPAPVDRPAPVDGDAHKITWP